MLRDEQKEEMGTRLPISFLPGLPIPNRRNTLHALVQLKPRHTVVFTVLLVLLTFWVYFLWKLAILSRGYIWFKFSGHTL